MATGDTASDPSPRPWPNEGEEGSLTFQRGTPRSWPARAQQGSNIAKEHSQSHGKDAQEVRPSTHAFERQRSHAQASHALGPGRRPSDLSSRRRAPPASTPPD